jgi:hypothetical protein
MTCICHTFEIALTLEPFEGTVSLSVRILRNEGRAEFKE